MADDESTTDAATTDTPASDGPESGKTFTQDQLNQHLARQKGEVERKYEGFDDLKAKADEFDKLKDSQRSDLERLAGERDKVASDRDTVKAQADAQALENMKLRVGIAKGLKPELIDRLRGDSQEDLEADAEELKKLQGGSGDWDAGVRRSANDPNVEPGLSRLAHAYSNK